jgi:hypothetical protein
VKRLNAITAQLAELDFLKAPVFTVNGLKREELTAANSSMNSTLPASAKRASQAPR